MTETLSGIRRKRGFRRGRLTACKKQLDEVLEADPRELVSRDLEYLRSALSEEADNHRIYQTEYEKLLAEESEGKEEDQTLLREMESGADFKALYDRYIRQADDLIEKVDLFHEAQILEQAFDEWSSLADITARLFLEETQHYSKKFADYLSKSQKISTSEVITSCRTSIKAAAGRLQKLSNELKEKEPPKHDAVPVMESKPFEYRTKFDIDLPTFNGKPIDWAQYHSLFSSTLETRGKHLSQEEKSCLLIKSLKDPQAKELASLHTRGVGGYDKAMSVLVHRYGRASVILPHHIETIDVASQFTFTSEGLRALGKQYGLTYLSLKDLGVDLSSFLAADAASKFDSKLTEEWVKHTATLKSLPTMEDLTAYIQQLEDLLPSSNSPQSNRKPKSNSAINIARTSPSSQPKQPINKNCILCPESIHALVRCPVFKEYSPERRGRLIKDKKWCSNCLHPSHISQHCTSAFSCRQCGGRHHTLLHKGETSTSSNTTTTQPPATPLPGTFVNTARKHSTFGKTTTNRDDPAPPTHAFLNTALVNISHGNRQRTARLALDSGSSTSLISESLASSLKLRRYPHRLQLEGAYSGGASRNYVQATLRSLHDQQHITIKLSVVAKLPYASPPSRVDDIASDPNVKGLQLADSQFGGYLDILLGNLDVCKCSIGRFQYFTQQDIAVSPTIFGWTVSGPLDSGQTSQFLSIRTSKDELQESLDKLLAIQQVPESSKLTAAERSALHQFDENKQIQSDGRYSISLPRIDNPPDLGQSRKTALSRLYSNERSLSKKGKLEEFDKSLREYQALDHAELVPSGELHNPKAYYLPVHGVFKETSTTTKVRPVFDASSKSSSGSALNDLLLAGPNLYPLLTDILIQFRSHKIGFSSDISKMFREIQLNINERDLHRFLMRTSDGNIQDFRMRRLTFGVKSSPFLATKVLHDLAERHSTTHPTASKAILQSFYVDDFLSGASTVEEAAHIREEICNLLLKAGMTLRKWRSSCPEFSSTIPAELLESSPLELADSPKALGIHWDVQKDSLNVSTPTITNKIKTTKRIVASEAAKVYDLLGFFAPYTIVAKIILQRLWTAGTGWDEDNVPENISTMWQDWYSQLPFVHKHSIDRRYDKNETPVTHRSLHGFSDASESAYGAVIYLKQLHADGQATSAIVIAKARVAPLKSVTIPRMELVAAHLLEQLLVYASKQLDIPLNDLNAWTDSSIVLAWLRKAPSALQVFVANRTAHINTLLPEVPWRHISTKENPADILSRGVSATKVLEDSLWWHGPQWLTLPPDQWKISTPTLYKTLPEQKAVTLTITTTTPTFELWSRFSSFDHLTRVLAWIRRFHMNIRQPQEVRNLRSSLDPQEISSARTTLLKTSQQQTYPTVVKLITQDKKLPTNHPLSAYNVTLNDNGLIEVSGRVRQLGNRMPKKVIALSLKSDLTKLLITTQHRTLQHPGVSAFMAITTENYFISGLKSFLKSISRSCVTCQRAYSKSLQPSMGMLPSARTTPSPPFTVTGVDFAGPFIIKEGHTRRPVHIKAYLCLFVCFSTKAVHLELCTSLSTPEFIGTLRRFCSRRGSPADIHSDNGTNFVGAAAELKDIQQLLATSEKEISHFCTSAAITWHFIPPRAPNFGGLWEAGVKQAKLLMRKLIAPYPLKFDELYTIITEVEAILNSRPITPLDHTETDSDLVLTPGHFLIGRPLKSLPRLQASTAKVSSLRRWSLVQRLQQDFWVSWQAWYLQTLEARTKKNKPQRILHTGDVVLIKDSSLSTNLDWPLARITSLHPGDDGTNRVADLLCQGKHYTRAINRLIPIVEQEDNHSST